MERIPNNPLWEDTSLTLDERGLGAVKEFLKNVAGGKPPSEKPTIEERKLSLWEPPIDNEVSR